MGGDVELDASGCAVGSAALDLGMVAPGSQGVARPLQVDGPRSVGQDGEGRRFGGPKARF